MNCPNCNVPLTLSERQGVEIDYCPRCRGVWLDRGELDKLIERSHAPASYGRTGDRDDDDDDDDRRRHSQPYPQQHYPNAPHGPGPYPPKRRKSWLEELFD